MLHITKLKNEMVIKFFFIANFSFFKNFDFYFLLSNLCVSSLNFLFICLLNLCVLGSRCGLCDTYYIAHVKEACAFLGDGMSKIEVSSCSSPNPSTFLNFKLDKLVDASYFYLMKS